MTRRLAASIIGIPLLLAAGAIAQTEPPALEPDWTVTIPDRIEWIERIDLDSRPYLLIASEDQLRVYDAATGRPALCDPLHTNRGVRFAGTIDEAAFAFDRYALYGIGVLAQHADRGAGDAEVRLRSWKMDDRESFKGAEAGDPEFLTRILAAAPTPLGLLAVRSDGRIGLFATDDGRLIWRVDVAPLRACELYTHVDRAALITREHSQIVVRFFNVRGEPPALEPRRIGTSAPLLKTLTSAGLVMVETGRALLIETDGTLHVHPAAPGAPFRAALTVIEDPGDRDAEQQSGAATRGAEKQPGAATRDEARGPRLWQLSNLGLRSIDLSDGALFSATDRDPKPAAWNALESRGGWLLARAPAHALAARLASRPSIARFRAPADHRIQDAQVRRGHLLALLHETETGSIRLASARLRESSPTADDAPAIEPRFTLEGADDYRGAIWLRDHVLVYDKQTVRVYPLPR